MKVDNLFVEIYKTRAECGFASANEIAKKIKELLYEKDSITMIFAAAPSQNEMLENLIKISEIDWNRITAFHMDEYVGIDPQAPQAFGQFLRDRIFDKVPFKQIHIIETKGKDINNVCEEYSKLLNEKPIDIVCMGIGENGHIAFNDPPFADFNDSKFVKVVELDEVSRQQQVNDGCFKKIDDVPKQAITLTIPALFSGQYLFVIVPGKTKAKAVKETLRGPITENCPATILRNHKNTKLYLDIDSSALL
ncbi:MAG: glucosamine-6-phosphate deaminase [Ignavibacteriae bacterium]|nr:glucosamine-6-phosphate deaminase [Ignavibacteriota bacterium]